MIEGKEGTGGVGGPEGSFSTPVSETKPGTSTKKPFILALLVLVIVFLLLGAVYAGTKLQEKKTQTPSSQITPPVSQNIPTVVPAIDQTANWKTYTNTKYGFSLKYPNLPKWNYDDSGTKGEGIVVFYNYNTKNAPGRSYSPEDGDLFKAGVYIDDNSSSVDQWLFNKKREVDPVSGKPTELFNLKEISVDSNKGIYFELKDPLNGMMNGMAVFDSPSKKVFVLHSGLNYEANKNVFDQMLSSFKFLDQSTTDPTANWKTYTNSKHGFSFKYPVEYKYKENNYPKEFNGIYSYTQFVLADAKAFSPEPIGQPYIMLSIIDSTDHKNDSVYNNSTSIGSMSVAGIQADVRRDAQGGEVVVFIKGNSTYEFNLTNYAKDVTLKDKLYQILSTFKFLR